MSDSSWELAMAARSYLRKIRELDDDIRARKRQRDELRASMASIGSPDYGSDPVQTSKNPDAAFTRAVERMMDLDAEAAALIAEKEATKAVMLSQIDQMKDNRYRTLLRSRYVYCERFEACACELNYSLRQTLRLHKRALLAFGEQHKEDVIVCHMRPMV